MYNTLYKYARKCMFLSSDSAPFFPHTAFFTQILHVASLFQQRRHNENPLYTLVSPSLFNKQFHKAKFPT